MTDKQVKELNDYKRFKQHIIDILDDKLEFYDKLIDITKDTEDDDVRATYCGIYDELVEIYQLVKSKIGELNL